MVKSIVLMLLWRDKDPLSMMAPPNLQTTAAIDTASLKKPIDFDVT